MGWTDLLIITFGKLHLLPKAIIVKAFFKMRERYFKADAEIERLCKEIEDLRKKLSGKDEPDLSPSTPSSQIPPYKKPNKREEIEKGSGKPGKRKKRKKNGQKKGHKGTSRSQSREITHEQDILADGNCECGGNCSEPQFVGERIVEDIEVVKKRTTRYSIYCSTCKKCGKVYNGIVPDVLKGNLIGNLALIWGIYLHFAVGVSFRNVQNVMSRRWHDSRWFICELGRSA